MPTWVRWILENLLPDAIDHPKARRVLHWVFWPATVLMTWLFTMSGGLFGVFTIGAPLLIIWLTARIGISRIPVILLYLAGFAMMFPAFFLGLYQSSEESPRGLVIVGMLVFVVWVGAYPTMLGTLNRQYLERTHQNQESEPHVRIIVIRLWLTAVTLFAVGAQLSALWSMFALWHRQRWSAKVAWFLCLIVPLMTIGIDGISVNLAPGVVLAAVLGAKSWWDAARLPSWDERHVWS